MASKSSLKDQSIFLVIGNALTQGTTVIQGIILARILSQHDFGSFRQILFITALAYVIFSLCIAEGVPYFLAQLDKDKRKQFLFQCITLYVLLGLSSFMVMFYSRGWLAGLFHNSDLYTLFMVTSLLPGSQMIKTLTSVLLISIREAKLNTLLSVINSVLGVLSMVVPLFFGYSLMNALFVYVFTNILFEIFRIAITIKKIGITFRIDWALLKNQFGFSIPYWISYSTFFIYTQVHKVLVSSFFSPHDFAIFSVACTELPVLARLSSQIGLVLIPVCVQYQQSGKTSAVIDLWSKLTSKVALVVVPIFMLLILNSKEFMAMLYGTLYEDAWLIFSVMLLLLPLRICDTNSLFKITGKTKYVIISSVGALITGLLSGWLLMYPFGMLGPAIGVLIGRITQIVISLQFIKRDIPLSFSRAFALNYVWKLLLVSSFSFGLVKLAFCSIQKPFIQFITVMTTGGILFICFSIYFKIIDDKDIQLIKRWITLKAIFKS